MKRMLSIGVLVALLPLGACASTPAQDVGSAVGATPAQTQTVVDKVKTLLTVAHNGHKAAADLAKALADDGVIHGTAASTVQTYLDKSEAILNTCDNAVKLGDTEGITAQIAAANGLVAQAEALFGH